MIDRHNISYIEKRLAPHGIGAGQFRYILLLHRNEGINQEQLSQLLELDKTTTARAVAKLLTLDIVQRETDPADNRSYLIHLTTKGREMVPVIENILGESTERMVKGFAPDDRKIFISYLTRVHDNLTNSRFDTGGDDE
jgi:DNA-binding MarR family transcriptional regulator